jgi:signal transduction histidine kinase/CheY-like chemotaxis protein
MNVLMSCNPLDSEGACPEGNLATFFEGRGGTGSECGYVLYPPEDTNLSPGVIAAIVVVSVVVVIILFTFFHWYRLERQKRLYAKRSKAAMKIAERERELNEYIAHEGTVKTSDEMPCITVFRQVISPFGLLFSILFTVRNPLSSAIAALNFVSSKASDPVLVPLPENRESINSDIHVVDSSLQFVNELLRNMLDLHRSANKEMKLNMEPTDILQDVIEPVASILFMRGAKVEILTDCPQNLIVNADQMRLKQILLNLANNAVKFVEKGYIRLRAEVVNGDNVEIKIEDSGAGIPLQKRKQLFDKFQESLDVLNQGTGIGLSVCKNLSTLMGADLFLDGTFDSGVPGCPGTRFTLRLNQIPLDIENGLGGSIRSDEFEYAEKELPEAMSVLFVDDDTMIRKMFSRTLRTVAPTWTIREASSGETALCVVDEERFDVIFVDQYMASHTKQLLGTETVHALRAKGVDSIVCGLSANDIEEEFLQAGADEFMLKPFPCQKDALKRELFRILEHTRVRAPEAYVTTMAGCPVESTGSPAPAKLRRFGSNRTSSR